LHLDLHGGHLDGTHHGRLEVLGIGAASPAPRTALRWPQ
jgi:hypothetical protein